jgi:hypothetical protein
MAARGAVETRTRVPAACANADFLPLHRELMARTPARHGLVLFTNRSFPRHRSDVFIRAMVAALDDLLTSSIDDVDDGRVIWLSASSSVSGE